MIHYFPVRHFSPACSYHLARLMQEVRPEVVLVEGPRDATGLIPFLLDAETQMPVALYATYVAAEERHAAYYPLCDYSPELVALQVGHSLGAQLEFIDLTLGEKVEASTGPPQGGSLLEERHLQHSRFLQAACQRAGARDPDDLWDCLYETNFAGQDTAKFIEGVLAYCAMARRDYSDDILHADGTLTREAAMAAAVADHAGKRVLVVTGGFHTVALPGTSPARPPAKGGGIALMRYGFEQLDRLNGYAAGLPSPEFYQRLWESPLRGDGGASQRAPQGGQWESPLRGDWISHFFVELGRQARPEVSVADEIAARAQVEALARFRGHAQPSREDLLDGVRSVLTKGSHDGEILALARRILTGNRVGSVPARAGQAPILLDFHARCRELELSLDWPRDLRLDLYRRPRHRLISRFFHRLRFLSIPLGRCLAGPDFVLGTGLERVQETWSYRWTPAVESALIERSLYGASVEEAAGALLGERFLGAERVGQGRRADQASLLVLDGCRMGLHRQIPDLLQRLQAFVAEDADVVSLVWAGHNLLILKSAREPLEAHDLEGLEPLAQEAYRRACYLLPALAGTAPERESEVLDALNGLHHMAQALGDGPGLPELRWHGLEELFRCRQANPALRGGAAGLLHGDGQLDLSHIQTNLRGPDAGFLRGLLATARSLLFAPALQDQAPTLLYTLDHDLAALDEESFRRLLPELRLAFADLTPRETDRVAQLVSHGELAPNLARPLEFGPSDFERAAQLEAGVRAVLERDGLLHGA